MDPMGFFHRVLITAVDCWNAGADLGDHDKRHLAKHEAWTKSGREILLMEEILDQLRLVVSLIICNVLLHPRW